MASRRNSPCRFRPALESLESRRMMTQEATLLGNFELCQDLAAEVSINGETAHFIEAGIDSHIGCGGRLDYNSLVRTDGTLSGTNVVRGVSGEQIHLDTFESFGNKAIFRVQTGGGQIFQLWETDGSEARIISRDLQGGGPLFELANWRSGYGQFGDLLFFVDGEDLFATDGEITTRLASRTGAVFEAGGEVYFADFEGGIWKTDGTEEGTRLHVVEPISEIPTNAARRINREWIDESRMSYLMDVRFDMSSEDGQPESHLLQYRVDLTAGEVTELNRVAVDGPFSSSNIVEVGKRFLATSRVTERDEFVEPSPGTLAQAIIWDFTENMATELHRLDLTSSNRGPSMRRVPNWGHDVALISQGRHNRASLHRIDEDGLHLLATHSSGGELNIVHEYGNYLFFSTGEGFWVSDGSEEGTIELAESNGGPIQFIGELDRRVLFSMGGVILGTDLTTEGTDVIGPYRSEVFEFREGRLYFWSSGGMWRTDGTSGGTRRILDAIRRTAIQTRDYVVSGAGSAQTIFFFDTERKYSTTQRLGRPIASPPLLADEGVILWVDDGALWHTDGTPEGTYAVGSGPLGRLIQVGDHVLFDAITAPATPFDPQHALYSLGLKREGDLNGDRRLTIEDFLVLSSNFGSIEATEEEGDLDGNGKVDVIDFLELSKQFAAIPRGAV